ncbi:cell division protein FtsQ/DivIB [Nakamurella aerolata]|uniref:FtsQ-type POTRA domain-containing protein n=1 Tax=Nakamurella aerolata TaxID=1656892 RepID=A0A849AA99_9ACTN|nr:FtsQ-type POTRA domain-containing protein [Nakamurella aerolata]NNG36048.1 FtsQ-type POTRA domain-containing protein [Nakamurella aerolata]
MTATTERQEQGASRAARPRSPRRRRNWPWVLAFTLVLTLLAGGWYVLYRSSWLAVGQVTVMGADAEVSQQVRQRTAQEIGKPLVSVDLEALDASISDIPQVADATVTRRWPDQVQVTVQQRVPVATTQANGRWWLMDSTGLPYLAQTGRPATLPVLQLATPGPGDPATKAAISVANSLPESVSRLVSSITAGSPYEVVLVLDDGRKVIWGDGTQAQRKAQVLALLLNEKGTTFNLTNPDRVTVK